MKIAFIVLALTLCIAHTSAFDIFNFWRSKESDNINKNLPVQESQELQNANISSTLRPYLVDCDGLICDYGAVSCKRTRRSMKNLLYVIQKVYCLGANGIELNSHATIEENVNKEPVLKIEFSNADGKFEGELAPVPLN